jgi:hypothetical protein
VEYSLSLFADCSNPVLEELADGKNVKISNQISGEITMKKFFPVIFSLLVASLFVFSSVALAQNKPAYSKKAKVVTRGKVETAPKRKNPAVQKRSVMTPKPLPKKAMVKPVVQKAKVKTAAKKKTEKSLFWKMALNPVAMIVWVPLFLAGIAIVVQVFRLFPRREPEEVPEVVEEKATENLLSWDQEAWILIKEFASRFKKKPVLAASSGQ